MRKDIARLLEGEKVPEEGRRAVDALGDSAEEALLVLLQDRALWPVDSPGGGWPGGAR